MPKKTAAAGCIVENCPNPHPSQPPGWFQNLPATVKAVGAIFAIVAIIGGPFMAWGSLSKQVDTNTRAITEIKESLRDLPGQVAERVANVLKEASK